VVCDKDAELEYTSDEIEWAIRAQMRVNEDQELVKRTLDNELIEAEPLLWAGRMCRG
jgi:hypothetical protein